MNIKEIATKLNNKILTYLGNREPNFIVGENYLRRWYLIPRNPLFNIYYHEFKISDDPRFLHDHYYVNMSLILKGSYIEHTLNGQFHRKVGDIKFRFPHTLHRIEIPEGTVCKTLFITGPRIRNWGFQILTPVFNFLGMRKKTGWIDHETYNFIFSNYLLKEITISRLLEEKSNIVWKQFKKSEISKKYNLSNSEIDKILSDILKELQVHNPNWRLEDHFDIVVFRR